MSAPEKVNFSLSQALSVATMEPGSERALKMMECLLDVIDLAMEQNAKAALQLGRVVDKHQQ